MVTDPKPESKMKSVDSWKHGLFSGVFVPYELSFGMGVHKCSDPGISVNSSCDFQPE